MDQTFVELLERNAAHAAEFDDRFDSVQDSQSPPVVTVCCSDSRVLQDRMFGNETPGEIFTCGNIGNRVLQRTESGTVVSGDVLYPIVHTGTDTVVVVGHTGCGAVTATYDDLTEGISDTPGIEHCLSLLKPALEPGVEALPSGLDRPAAINRLVEYNVDRQIDALLDCPDVPAETTVVGVVYDFQDVYEGRRGEVHVINVGGERDMAALRDAHSEIADRIDRLWTY